MSLLVESFSNHLQCPLPPSPRRRPLATEATTDDFPLVLLGTHPDKVSLLHVEPLHPAHRFHHSIDGLRGGRQGSVGVRGIDACVSPHFFEVHRIDGLARRQQFIEPALESEEAHATSFEALRLEMLGATGNAGVQVVQCPAGVCAQIEGEDAAVA